MLYQFDTDSLSHAKAALLLYGMYRSRNKNGPLNGLETWDRFQTFVRGACLKASTTAEFVQAFCKKAKIDSVGLYRAYRIPNVIRTVKDGLVTFWAMGHRDEVQELLDCIPAVGKKYAAGYGLVDRWAVEDCEEDYSLWHPEHGLMRPVEADSDEAKGLDLTGYPVMQYGVKPPYWKAKNLRLCYVTIC